MQIIIYVDCILFNNDGRNEFSKFVIFKQKNENLSKIKSSVFMKIGNLHNGKQPFILLFLLFKNVWSQN